MFSDVVSESWHERAAVAVGLPISMRVVACLCRVCCAEGWKNNAEEVRYGLRTVVGQEVFRYFVGEDATGQKGVGNHRSHGKRDKPSERVLSNDA